MFHPESKQTVRFGKQYRAEHAVGRFGRGVRARRSRPSKRPVV
jgi:hypothetical protein